MDRKFAFCGIAHDDFARVTGLIADKRREVLRPGRCAEIKIERIKLRAHKLIQHASRENSTLSAAFAPRSYSSSWNGLSDNGAILPSVTGIRCPTSAFLFLL